MALKQAFDEPGVSARLAWRSGTAVALALVNFAVRGGGRAEGAG